jgi:hypothetical protein
MLPRPIQPTFLYSDTNASKIALNGTNFPITGKSMHFYPKPQSIAKTFFIGYLEGMVQN